MIPGVDVDDLAFTYPGGNGISGISFMVQSGEICCIYGKNGAGKSTLLNLLSTWYRPKSGIFRIMGQDGIAQRALVRTLLFPVFDENAHFDSSTGRENLNFFGNLYQSPRSEDIDRVCRALELNPDDRVGRYSLGMRRKLTLAESLVSGKPVLLFDEPTLGLDSQTRDRFFSLVRERADKGAAVIYGTNRIGEVRYGNRILHLTKNGIKDVNSDSDLLSGQIPVKIVLKDQTITEYLEKIDDLPALIARIITLGTPRSIEIQGPPDEEFPAWTKAAEEKLLRAPAFMQPMIKKLVLRYAREKGYVRITADVVEEARRRFDKG
ncbi:MAG: ATP-binding cassette domain-containing protein [Methanomicrobiales archaeon]|nr:ATP-binding cassette domain-containing protein [Methanomicrobiales archaeon]